MATVPVYEVERELWQQMRAGQDPGEAPALRSRMSNLIIFCTCSETAHNVASAIPEIVAIHPARVLLLIAEPEQDTGPIEAEVIAWCRRAGAHRICTEEVRLQARGASVARLPYAVRSLGLATFGPIELDRRSPTYGHILTTPKLAWQGCRIVDILQTALGVPVAVDTDVNAAALAEFEKAKQLDPSLAAADLFIGIEKFRLNRFDEASVALRRAAEARPKEKEGWLWLGKSEAALKRFREAAVALERAQEIDPKDIPAQVSEFERRLRN